MLTGTHTNHEYVIFKFQEDKPIFITLMGLLQSYIQFISDESCNETYIKHSNAGSSGGILQPKDINTYAICAARCIDYVIATEMICYGFDLNRKNGECTIYTQKNYVLYARNNIANYRRNTTCELPF